MIYTIDADYNVTAFEHAPAEGYGDAKVAFRTIGEFTTATASWPAPAFVAIWNGFAGVPPFGDLRPVKKFENAAIARKRIFAAIEKGYGTPPPIARADAPPLRNDAPPATIVPETNDMATKKKKGKTVKAKRAKTTAAAATTAKTTTTTRKDTVLGLIGRKKGATIGEIMEATGWQKHSVRGFIATLHTKHGVQIESTKNAAGERVYQGVHA